jgi:hypothetical protein
LGSDGHGVSHEDGRVDYQRRSHFSRDAARIVSLCVLWADGCGHIHFWVLASDVHHGGDWDTEVGGRPPEICPVADITSVIIILARNIHWNGAEVIAGCVRVEQK